VLWVSASQNNWRLPKKEGSFKIANRVEKASGGDGNALESIGVCVWGGACQMNLFSIPFTDSLGSTRRLEPNRIYFFRIHRVAIGWSQSAHSFCCRS
jgi:hypothetical protein